MDKREILGFYEGLANKFIDTHQWCDMFLQPVLTDEELKLYNIENRAYKINVEADRQGFLILMVLGLLEEFKELAHEDDYDVDNITFDKYPLHFQIIHGLSNAGFNTPSITYRHKKLVERYSVS